MGTAVKIDEIERVHDLTSQLEEKVSKFGANEKAT
jgi:hypothetical protein